ncbi:hypothetical protein [Akkermansia sp.]|uniref:hypothetical protein n=1 Tax=Akkermansia sp. TaxID=1872421 RepID=UPI0025BC7212|nr:hypothetical protein [Akkermansia sp.]MCD8065189.1 hypothetical protein [Akkermansia sp.]
MNRPFTAILFCGGSGRLKKGVCGAARKLLFLEPLPMQKFKEGGIGAGKLVLFLNYLVYVHEHPQAVSAAYMGAFHAAFCPAAVQENKGSAQRMKDAVMAVKPDAVCSCSIREFQRGHVKKCFLMVFREVQISVGSPEEDGNGKKIESGGQNQHGKRQFISF